MSIPQVNVLATDRNCEQTKQIYCMLGYGQWLGGISNGKGPIVLLPNGSFTLCQVVGMLEAEGVEWQAEMTPGQTLLANGSVAGWWHYTCNRAARACLKETYNPHDLTAAMDALIKVLEEKK